MIPDNELEPTTAPPRKASYPTKLKPRRNPHRRARLVRTTARALHGYENKPSEAYRRCNGEDLRSPKAQLNDLAKLGARARRVLGTPPPWTHNVVGMAP